MKLRLTQFSLKFKLHHLQIRLWQKHCDGIFFYKRVLKGTVKLIYDLSKVLASTA